MKLDNKATTTVLEDLARDLYELATTLREEIVWLMKEYDAQEINTEVCLDGYERERRLQSAELRGTSN
mgnify:CR=1 FL=1